MSTARIGYLIGLLTTLAMAGTALTAELWAAGRVEDVEAHAVIAGLAVAGTIIAHRRYGDGALWGFLAPAFICFLAGLRGLLPFWGLLTGYAVASGIGVWAALLSPTRAPFIIRSRERDHLGE